VTIEEGEEAVLARHERLKPAEHEGIPDVTVL
jgi:hypothetical protein